MKSSWFYAILADEVSDASGWEQLGVALRYVKNGKPCEKLVKFIACESIRGEDIDTKRCQGQGYDGTSNMSSAVKGCQGRFKRVAPLATYYHCASHQLNLCLSKAATVPEVHSMVCTLKCLGLFFKYSAKCQRALERAANSINEMCNPPRRIE